MTRPAPAARDYATDPFIVIWEVTRACALKCLHCRAEAQYRADPNQLTHEEGLALIDRIASMNRPLLVFTGGDPLMRPDLFELARYAIEEKGLSVSMTPSATPRVTRSAVEKAKEVGLSRWAFSLDGSCAEIHDRFRGTVGSFDTTMRGIGYLRELGIPIQVNTTVSRYNLHDLANIAERVREMGAVLWSLFFLVPTGRAAQKDMIDAEEHEAVMRWLYEAGQRMPYGVKATEAPHYRRVAVQLSAQRPGTAPAVDAADGSSGDPGSAPGFKRADVLGRAPKGVNDGDGFLFIGHTGDVYPSGFLPVKCGSVREEALEDIYRGSPIMRSLRDKSRLKGKCGACEFKRLCGGSRARAFAVTGDMLESDPCCAYIPAALREGIRP
ncbi:TIGR04053 family radical SAM/SPASM domain-containing protein [Saccharibacillus alkalitolerans]|uniref:TIGR04053 family radical SAM/SPASM domain-containing protein n=1 Tax=Saccharibacillus alkalitolerans TaxID=2705290 RepID=A0ABX0F646_9BACL|nr:TIGR04053 family radical SAM/SPASM domain-containing protein [Saccharibacillus alkalitolerans]NGZ74636.1 TIGR04053 family radical SAM/SPASM domain-containing protein [Saccharibacillus alkalitolerans]